MLVVWSPVIQDNDTNNCYNKFLNILKEAIDHTCSKQTRKRNLNPTNRWINDEIIQKCRQKRILYEDMLNGLICGRDYNQFCKPLRQETHKRKCYINSEFIINSQDKTQAT